MNKTTSIYSREAGKNEYTANIEAYYLKDWQGYDMATHSHDRMEIMYVIGGKCSIKTDDGTVALKKGEFILLDAGAPHGLKVPSDAPCRIMNIEFSLCLKRAVLSLREAAANYPPLQRFISEPRPTLVFTDTEDVYGVLRRMINCLDAGGEGRAFELELLSAELFMALSRLFEEGSSVRQNAQLHVRRAIQYMHQNYFRDITMKDISGNVGIAEGYLSRIFKQSVRETVMEYLTGLRIRKAKMLLEKTELPIIDISTYVGIDSRVYFSQMFKKNTGMSPGEYRKKCSMESSTVFSGCH